MFMCREVRHETDLFDYILSCATTADGEPNPSGVRYLSRLCTDLIDELAASVPSAFGGERRPSMAKTLKDACAAADINMTVAHGVVAIALVRVHAFRAHVEAHTRRERFPQILQFIVQNMDIMLRGLRADGQMASAKAGEDDRAYPTFEHLVWAIRQLYFSNWDPHGDFHRAAGVVAPVHDENLNPALCRASNARDRRAAPAWIAPAWAEVERSMAGK